MVRKPADIRLLRVGGMQVDLAPGFYFATVALLAFFLVLGISLFHRGLANTLVGAFMLVILHWLNETFHNYGHFTAARWTGFPMEGVRLGSTEALGLFGTSIYPEHEGELSARVHIRRAIGGPAGNAALGLVGLLVTFLLMLTRSHFVWVGVVFTAENFLVFVLGNFIPLGFNDGSTLLHWWRRR
ncbi:MAG: hypothetical protein ACR2MY_01065 [Candidatus Dormibacteria bacterium]